MGQKLSPPLQNTKMSVMNITPWMVLSRKLIRLEDGQVLNIMTNLKKVSFKDGTSALAQTDMNIMTEVFFIEDFLSELGHGREGKLAAILVFPLRIE